MALVVVVVVVRKVVEAGGFEGRLGSGEGANGLGVFGRTKR